MHKVEELMIPYVATSLALIVASWLQIVFQMIAALWTCNWKVHNILMKVLMLLKNDYLSAYTPLSVWTCSTICPCFFPLPNITNGFGI